MPDIRNLLGAITALVIVLGVAGYLGTRAYDASDTWPTGAEIHRQLTESVEAATSVRLWTRFEGEAAQVFEGSAERPNVRITLEGPGISNAELIVVGDQAFQRADACASPPCQAPAPEQVGKWLVQDSARIPTIGQVLRDFLGSTLVSPLADDSTRATRHWDGEQAVFHIAVPGAEGVVLAVTADGESLPVRVLSAEGDTLMEFSEWDSVELFNPPTADQVITESPAAAQGG